MYALNLSNEENLTNNEKDKAKPHIVLITVEGLNASSMSLYGYERDTTPFIKEEFSDSALIATNSFTNSGATAGSITSILTSKYPTNTRVLYPPDILRSEDAYEHLPGILKSHDYKTYQFSINHYADAYQLNMMNAFDQVNGRNEQGNIILSSLGRILTENVAYFYYKLNTRLMDRLSHLLFLEKKSNTYKQVTELNKNYNDFEKFDETINLLETATSPHFVHIHWMNTHGSKFFPKEQIFSIDQDPSEQDDWDVNFYNDSILEFDSALSDFWERLKDTNLNENTILIITSDHGKKYQTTVRIPMIIYFPKENHSRIISHNVQNLDIAPTILDYLNFRIPNWMEGKSLISKEFNPNPIISVSTSGSKTTDQGTGLKINNAYIKPPFYQFSAIFVVDCNKWYHFDLDKLIWSDGYINNYPNPCNEEELLIKDEISRIVFKRLSSDGFELMDNVIDSINSLK